MTPAEIQTTIDECADGSWQGALYIGSNFDVRLHAQSFEDVARMLARRVDALLAERAKRPE